MSDKGETVMQMLRDGWTDIPTLQQATGWAAHTLRAAISTRARRLNLKIERQRIDGVTSYRVAGQ